MTDAITAPVKVNTTGKCSTFAKELTDWSSWREDD